MQRTILFQFLDQASQRTHHPSDAPSVQVSHAEVRSQLSEDRSRWSRLQERTIENAKSLEPLLMPAEHRLHVFAQGGLAGGAAVEHVAAEIFMHCDSRR